MDLNFLNLDFLNAGLFASAGSVLWSNPLMALGIGVGLIIVTVLLFLFLKKIILNSIIGLILFLILKFGFGVSLPLIPAFVLSVLFGPAGIGAVIVLKFFNVPI